MTARGEVLVAILNNVLDFDVARDEHWYRIPVSSVDPSTRLRTGKWLRECWPPKWLAFYQTEVFGEGVRLQTPREQKAGSMGLWRRSRSGSEQGRRGLTLVGRVSGPFAFDKSPNSLYNSLIK